MKKFIFLQLLVLLLLVPTSVFASTSTNNSSDLSNAVNKINDESTIIETVENTRQNNSGKGFDYFMETIRKPSIPIGITIFGFAGLIFLVGFIIKPLQKIGGTMIGGVILGMALIHLSEYFVGIYLAVIDYIKGYL